MRTAALALAAACVAVACGGGDDDAAPQDPVEIAREQAEAAAQADGGGSVPTTTAPVPSASTTAPLTEELPAPDPATFEGANRIVNLWVGPGGVTQVVDVWAQRTFTNGPVLLVEDLAFGEASEYVAAPANHSLVVVGADAGSDGLELAGVFNAVDGEQITTVFSNDNDAGTVWAPAIYERSPAGVGPPPEPPADGTGLVYLYAPNTRAFESSLNLAIGSAAYFVGDGSGSCAPQRIEQDGFAAAILGGTQNVQLELAPGPATLTLHAWPSPDACAQPSLLDIPVEVVVGAASLVLVFSRDGESIEAMVLPMPLA